MVPSLQSHCPLHLSGPTLACLMSAAEPVNAQLHLLKTDGSQKRYADDRSGAAVHGHEPLPVVRVVQDGLLQCVIANIVNKVAHNGVVGEVATKQFRRAGTADRRLKVRPSQAICRQTCIPTYALPL